MPLLLHLALVSAASRLLHVDAQAVCPSTGLVSPDVVTLMVSPTATGWLVGPDCDFEEAYPIRGTLSLVNKGIERVVSTPPSLGFLGLTGNPLTRGANFSNMAGNLAIKTFSPKLLSNIIFPRFPTASTMTLADSAFTSLKGVVIPDLLDYLTIEQTELKSLKGVTLPSALRTLIIRTSKLTAIDLSFPPLLSKLEISSCPITKLDRVVFPDSLLTIELASNAISSVKGVTWPQTLQYLGLEGNPLADFEIRESDVPIFESLATLKADFSNVQCTDPTATIKQIKSTNFCVISDARFEALHPTATASPTPSTTPKTTPKTSRKPSNSRSPTTADDSASSSEDESSPQDEEASSSSSTGTNSGSQTTSDGSPATTGSSNGGVSSKTNDETSAKTRSPTQVDLSGSGSQSVTIRTVIQTKSSSNGTMIAVLVALSVVIAVLVGICIYRACVASKKKKKNAVNSPVDDKYINADTPGASTQPAASNTATTAPAEEYLANDVRNDKAMLPFRIAQKDVKVSKRIARGGYGVIYRAVYDGRDVAVKQMLPGTWHNDRTLASFMDEIRLCASLNHPKIVAFLGIAYSSLRDLSVVIEFMPGGDLHALLQKEQDKLRSAQEWSSPWTSSKIKCKAALGQDVAEAVGYLHSLNPPILHRDLKARNVLLDREGNAKLSDFGISRELLIDQTMTSEIGTAAWIAPEVLRGARYSEKADIYSLGVLLVELDRCQHPYAGEPVLQRGAANQARDGNAIKPSTMSHVAHKNTQIAVLVSTGKLRPSVSSDCPSQLAALVAQCLSFDPAERPSAIEVSNVLAAFVQGTMQ